MVEMNEIHARVTRATCHGDMVEISLDHGHDMMLIRLIILANFEDE